MENGSLLYSKSRHVSSSSTRSVEPSPFTPLLSLKAYFRPKWHSKILISPGTNPLRTHFVTRLIECVHIGEATAPAGAHCHGEYELAKGRVISHASSP